MFGMIAGELVKALETPIPKTGSTRLTMSRFRDLLIGIVLNLACNIESEEVANHMLYKGNVAKLLLRILVDSRHDWPSNGSALALLQYSHLALSNLELYQLLEKEDVYTVLKNFLKECRNKETKRHIYEALTLIHMSRGKQSSIENLIQNCYAAAA